MVRVLVNESESLQYMIIKTQIHQCSPLGCKIKHSRMKECSLEKDKKNLSILNEILVNNIS